MEAFLHQLLEPGREVAKVSGAVLDQMVAEVDKKLSLQIDAIMHAAEFKNLESAWRSMKYLVDKTDFRENIKIELLNVSKDNLLEDFEDSPEVVKSGLYKTAYTAEFGQFGGQPYGAMIANYDFGPGPQDVKLLQYVASVAAMSHAPFIASAGPGFFGLTDFSNLPNLKDLKSIFESPQYTKWRSFRESEDARYVALTMPRFLLRLPYGPETLPVKKFNYQEDVSQSHDLYTWGNAAFAFASRLNDSFAKYRWCANIIGPAGGGAVEDLPLHQFQSMGATQTKIPTEVLVSERREFELAEEGFIALTMRKGSDNAAFFSANSVQKPKFFGISKAGKEAELNYKLGHADAVHVRHQPPGALPQGAPEGEHRDVEGALGTADGAQHLDRTVRVRHGGPFGLGPEPPPAADGRGHRGGRRRGAGLVPGRTEGPPALQVHGGVLHPVARREAGQAVTTT